MPRIIATCLAAFDGSNRIDAAFLFARQPTCLPVAHRNKCNGTDKEVGETTPSDSYHRSARQSHSR